MPDRRISLTWHTVDDVRVIRIETSVSASALDKEAAAQKLGELAEGSKGKLVVDLSAVGLIDSRMLACIVSLNRKLEAGGGQLRICRVPPLIRKMLEAFGLVKVLRIDETDQDSLAALKGLGKG